MSKINVDENLVKHISDLARLNIHDSEIAEYQDNFQKILDYILMLDEVNTDDVQPLYNPITESLEFYEKALGKDFKERKDQVTKSLETTKVLKNASRVKNNEFKINAVIEE